MQIDATPVNLGVTKIYICNVCMQCRGRGANLQTNTSVILQMVKYSDYKRDLKVCPKEAYKQRHSEPGTASKDVVTFVLSTYCVYSFFRWTFNIHT